MPIDIELPPCVADYLHAENGDADAAVAHCFAADAQVRDEDRVHRGHEEIRAWKRDAQARYRYSIEPLSARREGERFHIRVLTTGDFPGSPVQLEYVLSLADGRIAMLEIH